VTAKRKPRKKAAPVAPAKRWYKVVVDGKSCHGGGLVWPMPTADGPGEWVRVDGELSMCSRGIHLTDDPTRWYVVNCQIFEVEPDEIVKEDERDRKGLCRAARLVRQVTDPTELASLRIFVEGSHKVDSGKAAASGSARVTAYDSARVTASGSARVTAYGSASVTAYDSASVTAYDSARVTAYGSVSVTAYGSVSVDASGSARVTAYDSVSVRAYDSASVRAKYNVTLVVFRGDPKIALGDNAVLVDRRGSRPVVTVAGGAA